MRFMVNVAVAVRLSYLDVVPAIATVSLKSVGPALATSIVEVSKVNELNVNTEPSMGVSSDFVRVVKKARGHTGVAGE